MKICTLAHKNQMCAKLRRGARISNKVEAQKSKAINFMVIFVMP